MKNEQRAGIDRVLGWSVVFGVVVWLVQWSVGVMELEARLLLLAPLVTVPVALHIVRPEEMRGWSWRLWSGVVVVQPLGALCAVMSFLVGGEGVEAVLWSSAWMVVLVGLAALGGARWWERGREGRRWDIGELGIDAGLVFVTVGGVWWLLDRGGVQPADFVVVQRSFELVGMEATRFMDPIVLLTAVHFHYAGFAAPIIAGLTARYVRGRRGWERLTQAGVVFALLGIPLTAVGITVSPWVEFLAAWVLASGLIGIGVAMLVCVLPDVWRTRAGVPLGVAGVSIIVSMGFAAVYAFGEVIQDQALPLYLMVISHGVLNALGFALCGLLGWALLERPSADVS